ncbi:transposase [Chryseobacterium sp. CBSDS_008]|uniref:transposase n=1 Tax=Chryseobacterium sp. CBSDS_008 TaxID=3415265 RepID=UPI003CED7336
MIYNFKKIHIGELIQIRILELNIETIRISKFFECSEKELAEMLKCSSLDCELLLKWSKLLQYDFFRLYTQHLIFYSPVSNEKSFVNEKKSGLPQFRKNIYSKDIVDFILEMITTGIKTKNEIIVEYNIPKTTLYKWIKKHADSNNS